MPWLLLLFIGLPIAEISLLVAVGRRIGGWTTLGIVVAVALLGAALARRQGLAMVRRLQGELAAGRAPTRSMGEGALLVAAGALFIFPGFITDALALLCLLPPTRRLILALLLSRLRLAQAQGRVNVSVFGLGGRPPEDAEIKDVAPEDVRIRRVEPPSLRDGAA
jgi:UPF0716 protein FxsA